MAGAIDKKINEIVKDLEVSPASHILARAEVLGSITLSREFAQTFLNALCETYTSDSGSYLFASSSVGAMQSGSAVRYTFPSGSHFSAGDFIHCGWRATSIISSNDGLQGTVCWIYNTLAEVSASF